MALIICLSLFGGCESGRKIWYNVDFSGDDSGNPTFNIDNIQFIMSLDELSEIIKIYDETYFDKSALLAGYLGTPNTGVTIQIKDLRKSGNALTIYAEYDYSSVGFTIICYWPIMIEVKKADIIKIKKINLNVTQVGLLS